MVRNFAGPAADAEVVVLSDANPWPQISFTDARGRFRFPHLSPAKYQLVVLDGHAAYPIALRFQLFDYADIVESVDLGTGERVTRDLRQHDPK